MTDVDNCSSPTYDNVFTVILKKNMAVLLQGKEINGKMYDKNSYYLEFMYNTIVKINVKL